MKLVQYYLNDIFKNPVVYSELFLFKDTFVYAEKDLLYCKSHFRYKL